MTDIFRQRMLHGSTKPHLVGKIKATKPRCPGCKREISRRASGKIAPHNNGNKLCRASNMTEETFINLMNELSNARRSVFN